MTKWEKESWKKLLNCLWQLEIKGFLYKPLILNDNKMALKFAIRDATEGYFLYKTLKSRPRSPSRF